MVILNQRLHLFAEMSQRVLENLIGTITLRRESLVYLSQREYIALVFITKAFIFCFAKLFVFRVLPVGKKRFFFYNLCHYSLGNIHKLITRSNYHILGMNKPQRHLFYGGTWTSILTITLCMYYFPPTQVSGNSTHQGLGRYKEVAEFSLISRDLTPSP